jgi:hypothetical protein
MRHSLLTIALSLAVAGSAQAQQLKIAFNGGHVSLDATSVPVRTILAEWSKLGGTKVVGAEKISGMPLTLKLDDVPESQALEVILRNVAGYMAAPRVASAGGSMYDRILVMATSSAPPPAAAARPTPTAPGSSAGTQRFVPQRAVVQSADEDNEPEEEPERPERNQPVFTFPQPGQGGFPQPGGFGPQGVVMPPGNVNPNASGQGVTVNPTPPPVAPYGSTGFGVVGTPMPGVIQQPPQPQQGQPAPPPPPGVRPPGA